MVLTLHNLAKAYKLLPSEAMDRASTFDLYVLDVATRYEQHVRDKQEGKPVKNNYGLTQEQMKAMLAAVRNKERKGGNKKG